MENDDGHHHHDSDQEEKTNQKIFNVDEAVPPTDYEAPYSSMPCNVVLSRVKQKVKEAYNKIAKEKKKMMQEKIQLAREMQEKVRQSKMIKLKMLEEIERKNRKGKTSKSKSPKGKVSLIIQSKFIFVFIGVF